MKQNISRSGWKRLPGNDISRKNCWKMAHYPQFLPNSSTINTPRSFQKIHAKWQRLTRQTGEEIFDRAFRHPIAGLFRCAAEVGSDDDIIEFQDWMIAGKRLRIGDIESGGVNSFCRESLRNRDNVDHRATGDIYE